MSPALAATTAVPRPLGILAATCQVHVAMRRLDDAHDAVFLVPLGAGNEELFAARLREAEATLELERARLRLKTAIRQAEQRRWLKVAGS